LLKKLTGIRKTVFIIKGFWKKVDKFFLKMAFLRGFFGRGGILAFHPQLQGVHNFFLKRMSGGVRRDFKSQVDFSKRTGRI